MKRNTIVILILVLLVTFAWSWLPGIPQGPVSLWPSVVAVGLAFVTRDIHLSLLTGAFAGALLLQGGNPASAFLGLFTERLFPVLMDRWNLSVLIFTLLMGGFVEVLNRNGGMAALTTRVLGRSGDSRRVGVGAYAVGWVLFFDGLANAMLVGKTLRPLADRARLSREKLAFIVDSTSSPIAGLALISTWVAYELSVIREGLTLVHGEGAGVALEPFWLLVQSLPFRFYNWFLLLLVFLVIWLRRDWGPMHAAEQAASRQPVAATVGDGSAKASGSMAPAVVPLIVLLLGIVIGLFVDGGGWGQPITVQGCIRAFGQANAALVFVVATAVASAVAMCFRSRNPGSGKGRRSSSREAFLTGMQQMFLPALILVLAWVLNSVIRDLGAAAYLASLLGDRLPPGMLPMLVFLLAATVSFSTGTSWGTMAIVMPLVIPIAMAIGGAPGEEMSGMVLAPAIGAVLAGAVFGDHCSPISDTTVVSSFSCGCDVMAHVRTQLPYALCAGGAAVGLGYGPAGWGVPAWVSLPIGVAGIWAAVRFLGRPV